MTVPRGPEVALYRRNAGQVTSRRVLHPMEKEAEIAALPRLKRKRTRVELEERWRKEEVEAAADTDRALRQLANATDSLRERLRALSSLNVPEFRGKVEAEVQRVDRAWAQLENAREALQAHDFGSAGACSAEAGRELWLIGGPLVIALTQALSRASIGRDQRVLLHENVSARQAAKRELETLEREGGTPEQLIEAAARVHALEAQGFELAGDILRGEAPRPRGRGCAGDKGHIVGSAELETEDAVTWDDVVLPDETRERLLEIVNVLLRPDLAHALGVSAPAGVLLYGPPGTGKTTIAKAMAGEIEASFYEQSATDLLSKWADESEDKVAKLFVHARANKPAILFIDEIDSLLRTRGADGSSVWEERVVRQFLRELDGIHHGEGVLLVGATNRIDIVDPVVRDRRLTALEIGLPDAVARLKLLQMLCRHVTVAPDVDLKSLATRTEGMSGADLKRLRDAAGMKALSRAPRGRDEPVAVTMRDLSAALEELRAKSTLVQS